MQQKVMVVRLKHGTLFEFVLSYINLLSHEKVNIPLDPSSPCSGFM